MSNKIEIASLLDASLSFFAMYARIILTLIAITNLLKLAAADHLSFSHSLESVPMTSRSHLSERHHINDHLGDVVGDLELMQEDELKFLYFRMHDSDGNEKLDGRELVDSLLHFHGEEGSDKIFGHEELANLIDPILLTDDKDSDGFIDYHEFVTAQKARGF